MNWESFEERKRAHLSHALNPAHQATGKTGLESISLVHEALPELNLSEISLESLSLERKLTTPFYVAGMTAGHPDAVTLNFRLAEACERRGWAMGVGSQRRQLEGDSSSLDQWQKLRDRSPRLQLFANIGISQLIASSPEKVVDVAKSIQAQGLAIHLNALQECLQMEGTPFFKGGLQKLEELCKFSSVPVILKETGCGFSRETLQRVSPLAISAIDVSGLGGTHWGRIEGARASDSFQGEPAANAAQTFQNWGVPTVESVQIAREVVPSRIQIWASGGVRSGLDAAKLIALGAHRVGYAQPALEAALMSEEALDRWMALQEFELKIALFCTGSPSPDVLRERSPIWKKNDV